MTFLEKLLLLAVVLQVALTMSVLLWLGSIRVPLVAQGKIRARDIALKGDAWPLQAQQLSNNFSNQFELPVLFYLGAIVLLARGGTDLVLVILAFLFVALRAVHAFIHGTTNHVVRRFQAYFLGLLVLVVFWAWLAVKLLLLAP